jgi:hypothetical protein
MVALIFPSLPALSLVASVANAVILAYLPCLAQLDTLIFCQTAELAVSFLEFGLHGPDTNLLYLGLKALVPCMIG